MFEQSWREFGEGLRRHLEGRPATVVLLCLMMLAAFDPIGEMVDLVLLGEAEAELLLLDLEIDAVLAVVLPFYYTILTLIILALVGRGVAAWCCRAPQLLLTAISLRPPVASKVPIR